MPAIVTRWLTMSYLLTSQWLTESMVSKILHRKHFVYDSKLWEGRGPDLGKIHTFSRFLESVPFDMYSETDFGSEKSIGSIIFRLKLKHESMYFWTAGWGGGVNIFLPVFKSLKFSLQYEILNLEVFLQINGANYALVVDNTNFHFQTSLNQFWIPVKATCFFMVQKRWYVQ